MHFCKGAAASMEKATWLISFTEDVSDLQGRLEGNILRKHHFTFALGRTAAKFLTDEVPRTLPETTLQTLPGWSTLEMFLMQETPAATWHLTVFHLQCESSHFVGGLKP